MKILGIEIADNTSQLFLRITLFLVLLSSQKYRLQKDA